MKIPQPNNTGGHYASQSFGKNEGHRERIFEDYRTSRSRFQVISNGFRDWIYYSVAVGMVSCFIFLAIGPVVSFLGKTITEQYYLQIVMVGAATAVLAIISSILWITMETFRFILDAILSLAD